MRSVVASHGPGSNPRGNAICNAILLQSFPVLQIFGLQYLDRHRPPSSDVLPLNLARTNPRKKSAVTTSPEHRRKGGRPAAATTNFARDVRPRTRPRQGRRSKRQRAPIMTQQIAPWPADHRQFTQRVRNQCATSGLRMRIHMRDRGEHRAPISGANQRILVRGRRCITASIQSHSRAQRPTIHAAGARGRDARHAHIIGYPRMSVSGESSTTMHRLLHASGSHPIPPPDDPNSRAIPAESYSSAPPVASYSSAQFSRSWTTSRNIQMTTFPPRATRMLTRIDICFDWTTSRHARDQISH
ncbi:hypothetical protein F511_07544 [Dorcoceras hygrometricum]|uniref:Uncharacterized protein n=1 Tax=Dorcoceras hygrometricum TaxID=472368 RepID=A0A2Z7B4F3_9LAMI|nr:hypothetical protein F511_07544 [Dorcoceras hygrometricum]